MLVAIAIIIFNFVSIRATIAALSQVFASFDGVIEKFLNIN